MDKINPCLHFRKVVHLANFVDGDENYQHLKKHLANCRSCQEQMADWEESSRRLSAMIPVEKIPRSMQEEFPQEVNELLREFRQIEKKRHSKFSSSTGKGATAKSFLKILLSLKMILFYLLMTNVVLYLRY